MGGHRERDPRRRHRAFGANQQPWTFVAVSDPETKQRIHVAAEREERRHYGGRMSEEWLRALEPLGTDEHKTHLTDAPVMIVVSSRRTGWLPTEAR